MMFIGEQVYIGFKGNRVGDPPLGFMTYYEENAAFEKRKNTIDSWSAPYVSVRIDNIHPQWDHSARNQRWQEIVIPNPEWEARILKNELLFGFKITEEVKRTGYNGGNVVWRIEDPRGFELEISSANMAAIMSDCIIDKGEIKTPCIWAWNKTGGSRLVLLPKDSEPHKEAIEATKLTNNTVSMKDVSIGDTVKLKNGLECTYLGRMYAIKNSYEEYSDIRQGSYFQRQWDAENRTQGTTFVPGLRDVVSFVNSKGNTSLMFVSKLKVSNIMNKATKETSLTESVSYVNKLLQDGVCTGDGFMDTVDDAVDNGYFFVSAKIIDMSQMSLTLGEQIDINTYTADYGDGKPRMFVGYNGTTLMLINTYYLKENYGYRGPAITPVHTKSWGNNMVSNEVSKSAYNGQRIAIDYLKDEDIQNVKWHFICLKYKDELIKTKN